MEKDRMAAPEGLWKDITSQMGIEERRKTPALWYTASAAAALLALLFWLWTNAGEQNNQPTIAEVVDTPVFEMPKPAKPEQVVIEAKDIIPEEKTTGVKPENMERKTTVPMQQSLVAEAEETVETTHPEVTDEQHPDAGTTKAFKKENKPNKEPANTYEKKRSVMPKQQNYSKWSLALASKAGLGGTQNMPMPIPVTASNEVQGDMEEMSRSGEKNSMNSKEVHHSQTMQGGIAVQYKLSKRWGIESGLAYSQLNSESEIGDKKENLRLRYLGIPFKLNYDIVQVKRFTLYTNAGGEVEKCVKGTFSEGTINGKRINWEKDETVKVKPLQWSVGVAVGVQVGITNEVGVFAEGGYSHYFDDGSEVQTIRKETPDVMTCKVGIRFTLNNK